VEYVTVTADSREEAVEQLKKLYGPEIKVFSTKKIDRRSGLLRKKRSLFEVTAYRAEPLTEQQSRSSSSKKSRHSLVEEFTQLLENQDFPRQYVCSLLKEAETSSYEERTEAAGRLKTVLSRHIDRHRSTPLEPARMSILVGPTGTGKTTTAAKLAAHLGAVRTNKKIILSTIDTYRIGAKAQIETFGALMEVPVHTLTNTKQSTELLDNSRDADHIIIDTVGRSPKDDQIASQMLELLAPWYETQDVRTLLALPATMKHSDMIRTVGRFSPFNVDALIITKLDETEYVGALVCALDEINLPVAYITDGQRVPQDFHVFDRDLLLESIVLS
jgi:flagellar biosynthesis protein FlhF